MFLRRIKTDLSWRRLLGTPDMSGLTTTDSYLRSWPIKKNWRQKHLHSNKRMWSFAQQPINAFTGSFGSRNMVHLYEAPDGSWVRSPAVCSYFKLLKNFNPAPILATAVHPHYHLGRHLHIGNSISTRHFQISISREREKMLPDKI